MNDREHLKQILRESFVPLVEALSVHPKDIEFWIESRQIGVMQGIVIELRPNKSDAPRIYGKSRQNYNSLCVIVESIGERNGVPIKLGRMHDPVKHTEEIGRHWRSREEPVGGVTPLEHIKKLIERISLEVFKGEETWVESEVGQGGCLNFRIHVSPASPWVLQKQWESIQTIFKAICAPYGWLPNVEISQDLAIVGRDSQPQSADGRFSKEVRRK